MKSLAILDTADLDRAIGGVNRPVTSARNSDLGQLGAHIGQLANDFGFALPKGVGQTIDQVVSTVQSFGGNDCVGADADVDADAEAEIAEEPVEMWCGTPGEAAPTEEPSDPVEVTAETATDGKWDDIDLAGAPILVAESASAAAAPMDAASAPGGVIVSSGGHVADEPAAQTTLHATGNFGTHGFFDHADEVASVLADMEQEEAAIDAPPIAPNASAAPGGVIAQSESADAPSVTQLAEAQPTSGWQGTVRDHRGGR